MKKTQRKLLMGFLIACSTMISTAYACSVAINQEAEKNSMISALASYYGLPTSAIQQSDLTRAGFSFLEGFEDDCTGLESAVISSAFNFTAIKNSKRCTYKGVILRKDSAAPGNYFINDENPSCTPILRPIPIPVPIRPLPFNR